MNKVREEFIQEFTKLAIKKHTYAEYIDQSLESQKILSSQVKNTDWLIHSKLLLQQQRYERAAKEEYDLENSQHQLLSLHKKKSRLDQELATLRNDFSKVKETMLTGGVTISTLEQSKGFMVMLDELNRKKDLEQLIFENKLKFKDLEEKIQRLVSEKKTQELAIVQKGRDPNENIGKEEEDKPNTKTTLKSHIQEIESMTEHKRQEDAKMKVSNSNLKVTVVLTRPE